MRISDWSSDVCSSDLRKVGDGERPRVEDRMHERGVGEERLAKNEDRDRDQYGGGSDGAAPGQRRCMQIADIEEVEDLRDDEHVDDHRARNFEAAPLDRKSTRLNSSH